MKKIIFGIAFLFVFLFPVFASNEFITLSDDLFIDVSKEKEIMTSFSDDYDLSYSVSSDIDQQMVLLTKKVTYLLLGDFNNQNESYNDYYIRHQEYLRMRYNPVVVDGDTDSQEYKDDILSGISIPGMFLMLNNLGIIYDSFGDIRISRNDSLIISMVTLPNVKIKEENKDKPMEYKLVSTNLVLYYFFKEINGEYKLYYIMGETKDELDDYINESIENEVSNKVSVMPAYNSSLSAIYNYSATNLVNSNLNSNNVITLNAYYNSYIIGSANGFFINNGLVVTTWNFLENALINAQYITLKDNDNTFYEIDGIVTINTKSDIALLKLKKNTNNIIQLGDSTSLKENDLVSAVSSKTGVGLNIQPGVVVTNDGYIQSVLPLSLYDEGSILVDKDGLVVGMNTAKSINTTISYAIPSAALQEIQDKFNNINFEDVKAIPFDKIKEEYYYIFLSNEKANNTIPDSKWKKYSKIGDIENAIKLKLISGNYKDNVVSLRYYNETSSYIDSMALSLLFRNNLIEEGYKEVLASYDKYIYESNDYQIIIMKEFNYLIIVMVEL